MIHISGVLVGICSFLIIGIFHPIVIKAEYYFGVKCWWVFLLMGILGIAFTLLIENVLWASLLGVFSFSCLWSILEIFQQKKRVEKGWFPANPKRKNK